MKSQQADNQSVKSVEEYEVLYAKEFQELLGVDKKSNDQYLNSGIDQNQSQFGGFFYDKMFPYRQCQQSEVRFNSTVSPE